ncbi:MAG: tRNA threonylcarbamoyladenosine biosynthesis protein RimN, partial [Zetaproteobacteria bacterium]
PFVVLAATPKHALQLVAWLPRDARAQIRSSWPGRTTLVLPAKRTGWIAALAHRGGIALRVDAAEHVRYLCRLAGGWLVSTSLNRKGQPPIAPSMRLRWRWHRWLDAVDASRPGTGKPSEILRWRASGWQRLR